MVKINRLAPYGKSLLTQLSQGNKPRNGVWLFMGPRAWYYAKQHRARGQAVLLLPKYESPESLIWPVQDLPVLIFDLSYMPPHEMYIKRLAFQLLKSGAEKVYLASLLNDTPYTIFYRDGEQLQKKEPL